MPRPIEGNPREVRSHLHNAYSRYAHGDDIFPQVLVDEDVLASASPKSRRILELIHNAWQTINSDEDYFVGAVAVVARRLAETGQTEHAGLVITAIGRNAVRLGLIQHTEGGAVAQIGLVAGTERDRLFQDLRLNTTDGRQVHYVDSSVDLETPVLDGLIVRDSGASGIIDATRRVEPAA
jgi:hypothetical protein